VETTLDTWVAQLRLAPPPSLGFAGGISYRSRLRKFALFMEALRPTEWTTVLDVGADEIGFGEDGEFATMNFFEEYYPWPDRITAVGLHAGTNFTTRYPEVDYVRADGCKLPFDDGEFDAYFSNAVIEHVGGEERQRAFVAEALRVSQRVFMTTPNRRFPIELHTRAPFVHWLPESLSNRIYQVLRKPWATEIRLLDAREFASLFPRDAGVRIISLGMTLVAVTE
jgi:SAM-dependent methyltransferase